MKTFKEFTLTEKEDDKSYGNYTKNFGHAIEDIGKIIEYGRSIEMDNKLINPLLDALKGLHTADDAIRNAYEKTIEVEVEPEEEEVKEPEEETKW